MEALKETAAGYDAESCVKAMNVLIRLYLELRGLLAGDSLIRRFDAETYAKAYLEAVSKRERD